MDSVLFLGMLSGLIPLGQSWWANRHNSLVQSMNWALTAGGAWMAAGLDPKFAGAAPAIEPVRYLALGLSGCAGIAVLGARRPHVGAWNFVVLGLLAVMMLPLAESILLGGRSTGILHFVFVGAVLTVGIFNYLPTCLGGAALLLGLFYTAQMVLLMGPNYAPATQIALEHSARLGLVLVPWIGWWKWRSFPPEATEFDRLWVDFRNRFGLVWGQRIREQFNQSAKHAGWPVFLAWSGLRRNGDSGTNLPDQMEIVETLKALLKRHWD